MMFVVDTFRVARPTQRKLFKQTFAMICTPLRLGGVVPLDMIYADDDPEQGAATDVPPLPQLPQFNTAKVNPLTEVQLPVDGKPHIVWAAGEGGAYAL